MRIVSEKPEDLYADVSVINIPFPDKKYKRLLEICHLTEESELGDQQLSQLFVNAIYHFLLGNLSLDDFSCISNRLWSKHIKNISDTLDKVMYFAGELNFDVRRMISVKHNTSDYGFAVSMSEIMYYYELHRVQIVKGEELI